MNVYGLISISRHLIKNDKNKMLLFSKSFSMPICEYYSLYMYIIYAYIYGIFYSKLSSA